MTRFTGENYSFHFVVFYFLRQFREYTLLYLQADIDDFVFFI